MKLFLRYLMAFVVAIVIYSILQYIAVKVTINRADALSGRAFQFALLYLSLAHILGIILDAPIEMLTGRSWVGLACGYLGVTVLLVASNWNSADLVKILWSTATVIFVFVITFIVSTSTSDAVARRFSDKDSSAAP
jgi:hypothetical protein